jgi:putative endonuclease
VAEWYVQAGFRIVDRNWRGPNGELDLVVRDLDGTVVFCEVKTRRTDRFGTGAESVTATKQRRVRRLAAAWLAGHRPQPGRRGGGIRFDVGSVSIGADGGYHVEIVVDAF